MPISVIALAVAAGVGGQSAKPQGKHRKAEPEPPVMIYVPPPVPVPTVMVAPPAPPAQPAPPPPPLPPGSVPPKPATAPQDWITDEDYPAAALRAGEQGTVGLRLTIGTGGAVTGCTVTSSSGSTLLDNTACTLLRQRASFLPARTASGKAMESTWASRFTWRIPEFNTLTSDPIPATSWAVSSRMALNDNGDVMGCVPMLYGMPAEAKADPCSAANLYEHWGLEDARGDANGPVTVVAQVIHRIDGKPLPPGFTEEKTLNILSRTIVSYDIGADGHVRHCSVIEREGQGPGDCYDVFQYVPVEGHDFDEAVEHGTMTTQVLTSAKPRPRVMVPSVMPPAPPAPPSPQPLASWSQRVRIAFDANNKKLSCTERVFGTPPRQRRTDCQSEGDVPAPVVVFLRLNSTGPFNVMLTGTQKIDGQPMPRDYAPVSGMTLISRTLIESEISETGAVEQCRELPLEGPLHVPMERCGEKSEHFFPPRGADGKPARVRRLVTHELWTSAPLPKQE